MTMMTRRVGAACDCGILPPALASGCAWPRACRQLKKKDTYKVGFAQTESNNPWRLAQTASMKDEAAKRGWQLVYTDAAGSAAKQVADVNSMIAQGVDLIFLAPREEKPLIPAVMAAKKAGIPVILLDRNVDQPGQGRRGLRHLHRLGLRRGRQARRRMADQGDGRQGQDHRAGGHDRLLAGQRPQEGLRRRDQEPARHEDRRLADRRLRPRQGPPGGRDAAAGASRRQRRSMPTTTRWRSAPSRRSRRPARSRARTSWSSRSTASKDALQAIVDGKIAARRRVQPALRARRPSRRWMRYAKGEKIEPWVMNIDAFYDADATPRTMIAERLLKRGRRGRQPSRPRWLAFAPDRSLLARSRLRPAQRGP